MHPDRILPSSFLDNLGADWIAVDRLGTVIGRANTRTDVERACPDAAAYFCGADLSPLAPESTADIGMSEDEVHAMIDAVEAEEFPAPAEEPSVPAEEPPAPAVDGSAFDHDADGKVGGSTPKNRKRKPAGR